MNRKNGILIGASAIVLLLVSTQLISALGTVPENSTIVQKPASASSSINAIKETIVILNQMKMSTSNTKIQALASQQIKSLAYAPINPCFYLGATLAALGTAAAAAAIICINGTGDPAVVAEACAMMLALSYYWAVIYYIYKLAGCGILIPPTDVAASSTSLSISGCACAQ